MKNTKNMFLAVTLLLSVGMMHAAEYSYTGQAAVDHLIETGECRKCDLSGQDLRDAIAAIKSRDPYYKIDLSGANLTGTDLRNADLWNADLFLVNLSNANLSYANLCRANLIGADLDEANLSDANLSYANLCMARLRYTTLHGANLTGTYVR